MRSRIVTSCVSRSPVAGLHRAGRAQPGLTVHELTEGTQRRDSNARLRFFSELLTAHRIQHPTGHSDLHLITQFEDEAVGRGAPEPTDDFYGFAVKGVVTVVNDGCG
jgi:hypothetical protein